jgi:rhamnogalacturonyl hydrolase YesR
MVIDGIFMAEPFLTTYGRLYGDTAFCHGTVVEQTLLVASHAFNPLKEFLYHG